MSSLVLGTAGHVDHGKTALVGALTGVDTDRLPEEKARGISIALGFAQLLLPGGTSVALVDVPGHERFVRHMVAGASGIDGYLMCVAADDGVMPQTREHLAVLELLGVTDGVVAVTKTDLADAGRARTQIRELIGDGHEIVEVSTVNGDGIEQLSASLERLALRLQRRIAPGRTRLFVDRAFSVPGAGTVVTGTLWGAPISVGARVVAHPGGARGRVRGLQVHDVDAEAAVGGRVALNIAGLSRDQAPRGSCIVADPDDWQPSVRLDVSLRWLADMSGPLTTRRRLQLHLGTMEVAATCVLLAGEAIAPGARGDVQLRLEREVLAQAGDHFVLRSAQRRTVGGGVVVDAHPPRHGRGSVRVARSRDHRRDTHGGDSSQDAPRTVPAVDAQLVGAVADALELAGLRPPSPAELARTLDHPADAIRAALGLLVREGRAVAGGDLWFARTHAEFARQAAAAALAGGPLGIGALRDLWGVGRRHALALAADLDRAGISRRVGDERVLRRGVRIVSEDL